MYELKDQMRSIIRFDELIVLKFEIFAALPGSNQQHGVDDASGYALPGRLSRPGGRNSRIFRFPRQSYFRYVTLAAKFKFKFKWNYIIYIYLSISLYLLKWIIIKWNNRIQSKCTFLLWIEFDCYGDGYDHGGLLIGVEIGA